MIERRVSLSLPHRVFFTEGVFDPAQTLLRDVLCPAEAEANRVRRVLIVLEKAVAAGQPGLEAAIRAWFAAQDGLLADGREAALVIFRTKDGPKVQYMPMVGGILKKVRNSGELASISAQVAYDKDLFEYELGDDERIVHKPFLGEDRGKQIAVYAIAKTKDGAIYREVMSVADVEKVRAASKTGKFGPWVDWWDEMAKKTVIRRLAKRLPSSADIDQVMANDMEASGFEQQQRQAPINITPAPEEQVAPLSRLKASMAQAGGETIDADTGEVMPQGEAHEQAADA